MIKVMSNTSTNPVVFSSPTQGGLQVPAIPPATTTAVQMTVDPQEWMTQLGDVDATGLNDNDVLVYDQLTGKFKPVDAEVINNNDGGTW